MQVYILTYSDSSRFSPEKTLIFVSAVLHCREKERQKEGQKETEEKKESITDY